MPVTFWRHVSSGKRYINIDKEGCNDNNPFIFNKLDTMCELLQICGTGIALPIAQTRDEEDKQDDL